MTTSSDHHEVSDEHFFMWSRSCQEKHPIEWHGVCTTLILLAYQVLFDLIHSHEVQNLHLELRLEGILHAKVKYYLIISLPTKKVFPLTEWLSIFVWNYPLWSFFTLVSIKTFSVILLVLTPSMLQCIGSPVIAAQESEILQIIVINSFSILKSSKCLPIAVVQDLKFRSGTGFIRVLELFVLHTFSCEIICYASTYWASRLSDGSGVTML